MFGRRKKQAGRERERIQVDAAFESDVARVERSVSEYLHDPTDATRRSLVAALERLDDQTAQSDAYKESVIGSGALGYASKGEVFGETGIDAVVAKVTSTELHAQVTLVNAAKNEVRGPTPTAFAALQSASAALAVIRDEGREADDRGGPN